MFIAQVLLGPSKQLKQIIPTALSIVKNPNWPEANQFRGIYKRGRGFELGAAEKKIQVVVRAGLAPGTAGLRGRHADHSATLPPRTRRTTKFLPMVLVKSSLFHLQKKIMRCLVKRTDQTTAEKI